MTFPLEFDVVSWLPCSTTVQKCRQTKMWETMTIRIFMPCTRVETPHYLTQGHSGKLYSTNEERPLYSWTHVHRMINRWGTERTWLFLSSHANTGLACTKDPPHPWIFLKSNRNAERNCQPSLRMSCCPAQQRAGDLPNQSMCLSAVCKQHAHSTSTTHNFSVCSIPPCLYWFFRAWDFL